MKFKLIRTSVVLLVLAASFIFAGQVLAHALLVRSVPESNAELSQPPASLELWFSEPLEAGFSSARLFGSNGDEISLGVQTVDSADPYHLTVAVGVLEPGIYTVAWTTLSQADGHPWSGNFPFVILNPDGTRPAGAAVSLDAEQLSELPTPLQTAARWLSLIGGILLVGMAMFLAYVASELMQASPELEHRLNTLGVNLLMLAVLTVLLGSWLQIIVQSTQFGSLTLLPRLLATYGGVLNLARQALSVAGLLTVLWLSAEPLPVYQSRIQKGLLVYLLIVIALIAPTSLEGQGLVAAFALGMLLLLALVAFALRNDERKQHKRWALLLFVGMLALLGFSLGSHAAAVSGLAWAISFDLIHLLATSAWLGGLMLLPLTLDQYRKSGTDMSMLRLLFRRYGNMAKLSFFLLWATGLLNSLVQIPSWDALINTNYGRVLILKVLLMLLVWCLSIYASRLFRGRPDPAHMLDLLKRFSAIVSGAALTGLLLMVVVAVLVQTQPPPVVLPESVGPDYENQVTTDGLIIDFEVSPAQIGLNQFYVHLRNADGSLARDVQLVQLMFEQPDSQLGQSKMEMKPVLPGNFWVDGAFLNRPGRWKVSLYVRQRGLDDVLTEIGTLTLSANPRTREPFRNPIASIPVGGLWAGIFVLLGIEIFRWRKTLSETWPRFSRGFLIFGGVFVVLGIALGVYFFMFYE